MPRSVNDVVAESLEMLEIISEVSSLALIHTVCHHFSAPDKVCDPPLLPTGVLDCSRPAETWQYIRLLQERLDPSIYEVLAFGWHMGLEAIERTLLSRHWVESNAQRMCELADLSEATYGGWSWESYPPNWKGIG